MYYKDDFYKEFRTEKGLCEYLEEIDSRAEWIRVTSKKLKVAAAGEETCTEVPGISLEALEKDTLSHSRLVLILPERICYIGNSAIKSLKGRARIDGKALADVDKKTLAEILNKCLKVARGRALIRFCEGKVRAVLSGDEKDYAIISMPDMYMVTSAWRHWRSRRDFSERSKNGHACRFWGWPGHGISGGRLLAADTGICDYGT